MTALFATVLCEIFARFDADGDGKLNTAEMQAYARACNAGREFDDEVSERARERARARARERVSDKRGG